MDKPSKRPALMPVRRAHSGRLHLEPDRLTAELKAVFKVRAQAFLRGPSSIGDFHAALAMSGLVSEGIVLLEDAAAFAKACPSVLRADEAAYVEFLGAFGRPRCVKLSALTITLINRRGAEQPFSGDPLSSLGAWLEANPMPVVEEISALGLAPLALLERGAAAFWLEHLPGPLHADAIGVLSIVPINLSAIARRVSGAPLVRSIDVDADAPDVQAHAALLLDQCETFADRDVAGQIAGILGRPQVGGLGVLRRQQLDELGAIIDVSSDDARGLLYAFFAGGLLTVGTVRAVQPSASIQRRYFHELVTVIDRHPEYAGTLHLLPGRQRGELFDAWIQSAQTPKDLSAGLSALDMYFVLQYDIEPARVRSQRWEFGGLATPRILWDPEIDAMAAALPRCARTPVIKSIGNCLIELASQISFRPSDLISASLGDVHDYEGKNVVLDVHRHRGRTGQKTAAAAHPHEFNDPQRQIPHLLRHVQDALDRGRTLDEPLWGASREESRRNFQEACAVVSQLAKACTGDRSASFYSFRHTWFSRHLEMALAPGAAGADPRQLNRIAADGSHEDVTTSISWYFHLCMEVVRGHADLALESLLTAALTRAWSSLSEDAIHKRASRAKGPRATPLVDSIRVGASVSSFPCVTDRFPCAPLSGDSLRKPAPKLVDVLTALEHLDANRSWWLDTKGTVGPINDWELAIAEERQAVWNQFSDPVLLVNTNQEKLRPLREHLRDHGFSQAVQSACAEWRRGKFDGFIDVASHESLSVWLNLLKAAGIRPSRIVIRMVDPSDDGRTRMKDRFALVMNSYPAMDESKKGYKRPSAYLLLSSEEILPGQVAPSGAVHMHGFCSLMAAAAIRLNLLKRTTHGNT
jgi:hypothetical protein